MSQSGPVSSPNWLKGATTGAGVFVVASALSFLLLQTDGYHKGSYSWALLNALHYGPGIFFVYVDVTGDREIIATSAFIFIVVGAVTFQVSKSKGLVASRIIFSVTYMAVFLWFVLAMFVS